MEESSHRPESNPRRPMKSAYLPTTLLVASNKCGQQTRCNHMFWSN